MRGGLKRVAARAACLVTACLLAATAAAAPRHVAEIAAAHPHDPRAFTQGLLFADGVFYESVGRYGESALRRVDPETGEVLAERRLADDYFAEGLALVGERLIQLTWKAGQGFVYDRANLERIATFEYEGEGWGLAYDGERLIMSDGSDVLRFLDPDDYSRIGTLAVTHRGQPVPRLNELEYIDGEIWANVWTTDLIARIDPDDGRVIGIIDARRLRSALPAGYRVDVLNGIAHDPETDRLFLTGKWWPRLFEIRLRAASSD
ncbi:glutamine cyclotransferase [Salinisphaera sp. PC39]|uniref:glutaminyl-peptide cyclotransferase n=1 Tax=Salinisphaera sp. PC39 TaxID=1304156 RepID=UPI00333E7C82